MHNGAHFLRRRLLHACAQFAGFVAFVVTGAFGVERASAEGSSLPRVAEVQIGFDQHYRLGAWTPVDVKLDPASLTSIENKPPLRLEIQAPDGDGVPTRYIGPLINPDSTRSYQLYVRIGRPQGPIHVLAAPVATPSDETETAQNNTAAQTSASTQPMILHTLRDDQLPTPLLETTDWFVQMAHT